MGRFRDAWTALTKSPTQRQTVQMNSLLNFLGIDPDASGNALSQATYYACMKVLAESVGKLPLKILADNGKQGVRTMSKHQLYRVLHDRPNPYMTATTFWSTVEFNRNHYGNAYVYIDGAGRDTKLWVLPSNEVEVWYDNARRIDKQPDVYYRWASPEGVVVFGSEEVLHFKTSNTLDGLVGVSVREQLASTIDGGAKAQKMVNKMFDSGMTAKAVLQYTGNLSDDNVRAFKDNIARYAHGGLEDNGVADIIPIPLGSTLTPLNLSLADSQFVEINQYSALQIASAFGIKPYQVGDYTKSSYSSGEQQQLSFYVDTMLYILKGYEEEIATKLFTSAELKKGYRAKFNVAVVLRADQETQINTLSTAVNSFLYTPNEARALLDMEARPGGDRLLGNGASIPVELTGSQYTQASDEETEGGDGNDGETEEGQQPGTD